MNEIIEIIKKRRSIRSYKSDPVEREKLDLILDAAIWAPSSHNSQPWHFTVIKNEGIGSELNAATKAVLLKSENQVLQKLGKREDLFYGAPLIIIVSGADKYKSAIIDCSAATQNMLLVAESLGLSTCWIGLVSNLFREDSNHDVIKKLNLPEGYTPFYALSLGYGVHSQVPPKRKGKPIQIVEF